MTKEIRLGVTGLRQTGKTVFLTALIYQLTELGSQGLEAFENAEIGIDPCKSHQGSSVHVEPRRKLERFPYERHLANLREDTPIWPDPTVTESSCSLLFRRELPPQRVSYKRWLGSKLRLSSYRGDLRLILHDYPGEYLLDVSMLDFRNYDAWAESAITRLDGQSPSSARRYRERICKIRAEMGDNHQAYSWGSPNLEDFRIQLRRAYAAYVLAAQAQGMEMLQPGMTLVKWDQFVRPSSPVVSSTPCEAPTEPDDPGPDILPFVPLSSDWIDSPIWREMQDSFSDYLTIKVKPFAARLARNNAQLVMVDICRVLQRGVAAYNDLKHTLGSLVGAYHYTSGSNPWSRGISRVTFAATKADQVGRSGRGHLSDLLKEIVNRVRGEMGISLGNTEFEWFTSLRSTRDALAESNGNADILFGVPKTPRSDSPKAGRQTEQQCKCCVIPESWPEDWQPGEYTFHEFAPRRFPARDGSKFDHLNLDSLLLKVLGPLI